jgi:hypothetical protein
MIVFPKVRKIGWTFLKVSGVSPTIIDRFPSAAPFSPPLTGASNISQPTAARRAAKSIVAAGEIVLISMSTVPGLQFSYKVLHFRLI